MFTRCCIHYYTISVYDIVYMQLIIPYILILSILYIVPLNYLYAPMKWYSWQRNGMVLLASVEVVWSHVHPIWHTSQELWNWSRSSSCWMSGRDILVHVITKIVFWKLNVIYRRRYWIRYWVRYWGPSKFDCLYKPWYRSFWLRYRRKNFDI